MKNIIIFGANSEIIKPCAEIWAKERSNFILISKNKAKLAKLTNILKSLGGNIINSFAVDLTKFSKYQNLIDRIFKNISKVDFIFFCQGVMLDNEICSKNYKKYENMVKVNSLSILFLIDLIINYKKNENLKINKIVAISSVASDRGRSKNFRYASTKAMLDCFFSGANHKNSPTKFILVKPGPLDTIMTINHKKNFLFRHPNQIANYLISKLNKDYNSVIYVPFFWKYIMFIIKYLPDFFYKKIKF